MDGADNGRAAPAFHAARLSVPGPYAAGLFRPAHSHVRKRITRFVSTLFFPAGSPLSHRARQACIFAYASKNTGLFRSPFPLDDSRACW